MRFSWEQAQGGGTKDHSPSSWEGDKPRKKACLGTGTTESHGLEDRMSWEARLARLLKLFTFFMLLKKPKSTREKSFYSLLQASFQAGHGWSCNTKWLSEQTGQGPHPACYHRYDAPLHPIMTEGHRHLLNMPFAPFQSLPVCFK